MSNTKRKSLRGVSHYINTNDGAHQHASSEEQKNTSVEPKKQRSTEAKKTSSIESQKNGSSEEQKKVGYYLPSSLVDELEESWFHARRLTRVNISKSDFVRAALEEAIESFEEDGEDSTLAQRLMGQSG